MIKICSHGNGWLLITTIILVILPSCAGHKRENGPETAKGKNYEIVYAGRFTLEVTDSCTIVTVRDPWQGAEGIRQTYYLVSRKKSTSIKADQSKIIYVPVEKIICMSATHLAMIHALGESSTVIAVSGTRYVYDSLISSGIKQGHVMDVGFDSGLNTELILKLSPDLIMMYGVGSESVSYTGKIEELGIKVMFDADYLEDHPLGKAEWIKLFGALYCREDMADSIFRAISESYDKIRSRVEQKARNRPNVMLGLPFKDTWYISPGNSYISRLISDSGGNYLWADTESQYAMPRSIEDVFVRSLKADYWFNTGTVSSKNEIVSLDPRLGMIPCFKSGNLYNNNKRITPQGGNDYWETGTLYPDRVLKDIASILHPDLFPGYELSYYRKLE